MGQYICAPYLFSKNGAMLLQGRGTEGGGGKRLGEKGAGVMGGGRREGGVGFPRWREVGEKGGNYATLHNILQ